MSATGLAPPAGIVVGPLEQRYREHANFRAASDQTRVTPTHWHIAIANGLGWGFDGMDGVIFALASPLIIRDYAVTIPQYRSGLQIALLIGIVGMYAWPWLADRYGRRTLLALNIALFSLMMPVVAICPTFGTFVAARCAVNFALNGEWALGSMLVAETWPAHLRGRVDRHQPRHMVFRRGRGRRHRHVHHRRLRLARRLRGAGGGGTDRGLCARQVSGIALLGAHAGPQAPHRRTCARPARRYRRRIRAGSTRPTRSRCASCSCRTCGATPRSPPSSPAAARRSTARSAAGCRCIWRRNATGPPPPTARSISGGAWWASSGLLAAGWISDRFGRRPAFYIMLAEGAIFLTLWVYAKTDTELWIYGLLWSIGFLGFWAPSMILTAEVYPTRIRGVGNGFSWSIAWLVGFVLWPFVAIALQQHTGSFAAAFLVIPVAMLLMAAGIWAFTPDHAGKELDAISV